MMDIIRLVIYVDNLVWDVFYVKEDTCITTGNVFSTYKECLRNMTFGHLISIEDAGNCAESCVCIPLNSESSLKYKCDRESQVTCKTPWWCDCATSNGRITRRRKNVIAYLKSIAQLENGAVIPVKVKLVPPKQNIIDHAWARRMEYLAHERMVLNVTMSWLSTLGGAFSALGDANISCAGIAARISMHQFKIAVRLGDLETVARCRLYLALSLIQRGRLKIAQRIIHDQYQLAKGAPEEIKDTRLIRMCQGIWAKLKYARQLQHRAKYIASKEL